MKKCLVIVLSILMVFLLAACGNGSKDKEGENVNDALELLNTVWDSYQDDEKFAAMGGDMAEENMVTDAPGKYGIEDTQSLDSVLGFPTAFADKIDDAASLIHMMNANTFTCGAFHLKDANDMDALAAALKENIMNRQWVCGFPDQLVVVSVNDYVISFFGESEIVDTFKTKLTEIYASAKIISEDPIV